LFQTVPFGPKGGITEKPVDHILERFPSFGGKNLEAPVEFLWATDQKVTKLRG
jgi:hypothetical protein